MGGGRSQTVNYQPPNIPKDDTFERYLSYQQDREAAAERRAAQERAEAAAKEAAEGTKKTINHEKQVAPSPDLF